MRQVARGDRRCGRLDLRQRAHADADHASAAQLLLLGTIFNVMGLSWLAAFATLAAQGRTALTRPRVRRAVDRVSGVVLVALGVRIALDR